MFPIELPNDMEVESLSEVDDVIVRSITAGDPLIACQFGLNLKRAAALKGLALAKLLHGLRANWETFQAAGIEEEFEDFVQANMDVTAQTARKYSDMWKNIFVSDFVPDELKNRLREKPIQQLLLLNAAAEEGSLTQEEWETVVVADESKIREIVKTARGIQTSSKTAIVIVVVRRDDAKYPKGSLLAIQDGVTEVIGFLKEPESDFANKAIARLLNSAHVQERN